MHRCSTALPEEALSTYTGHCDPVYSMHWNRRHPDVFLSTSADWTVRLWLSGRSQVCQNLRNAACSLQAKMHLIGSCKGYTHTSFNVESMLGRVSMIKAMSGCSVLRLQSSDGNHTYSLGWKRISHTL